MTTVVASSPPERPAEFHARVVTESLVEAGLGDYATLFAADDALANQSPAGAAS